MRPRFCSVLALALAVLTMAVPQARAHAVLLKTDPGANGTLDTSPDRITLTFNESVGPIFLRVLGSDGADAGAPSAVETLDHNVSIALNEALTDGAYLVTYRAISIDTHPIGGSFVFTVGAVAANEGAAAVQIEEPTQASRWKLSVAINRTLQFASLLAATGLALFGLMIKAPANVMESARRWAIASALVAGLTYILAAGLGGAEMIGGGASVLFTARVWSMGLSTTLAPSLWLGLLGLGVLVGGLKSGFDGRSRPLIAVGIALSTAGLLVTGHAATASPRWFMTAMVFIHVICVAFWFGSFLPLIKTIRTADRETSAQVLRDFSFWAIISVALIVLSGVGISFIQVESFPALWETGYGVRLLIKLGLVVALLGLAGLNKIRLTPAVEKGSSAGREAMGRSINGEIVVSLMILYTTTTLSQETPPRALADQAEARTDISGEIDALIASPLVQSGKAMGFETIIARQGYTVQITLDPSKAGANMIMVRLTDASGEMFEALEVITQWSMPSAGLEPLKIKIESQRPGMYRATINELVIAGTWDLRVDALVDDFTKVIFRTQVPIR